jgi:hypothetical protein
LAATDVEKLDFQFRVAGEFKEENSFVNLNLINSKTVGGLGLSSLKLADFNVAGYMRQYYSKMLS